MPLSEHEQRALDELAQRLAAEDPNFGRRVDAHSRPAPVPLVTVGIVVGLGLLVAFCLTTDVALGVASFLVLLASLYALWQRSAERWERLRIRARTGPPWRRPSEG